MPPNDPLDALVAEHTRPDASVEARDVHRLILVASTDPARRLIDTELARIVRHIAGAGFDPHALERARGNIVIRALGNLPSPANPWACADQMAINGCW